MKWLLVLCVMVAMLAGCDGTQDSIDEFLGRNPDLIVVAVDENDDAIADVFVQAKPDGTIVLDADGEPKEVPGTRLALARAQKDDSLISEELIALAALVGVPGGFGLTWLGKMWGRVKPLQRAEAAEKTAKAAEKRANDTKNQFVETVASVQKYRDTLEPKALEQMNVAVGRISSETKAAIDDVKSWA